MSQFDLVILKNHLINRLNFFIAYLKNKKEFLIEQIKKIEGIDITEYLESYKKF